MNMQTNYTAAERRAVDKRQAVIQNICLQLAALGHKCQMGADRSYLKMAEGLLKNYSEHRRLLADYRCPADQRIQQYLNNYFKRNNVEMDVRLPGETFTLNEPGLKGDADLFSRLFNGSAQLLAEHRP